MRVGLQAGHYTPNGPLGGAPGEAAWTIDLAARLAERLQRAGVEIIILPAWHTDNSDAPQVATERYDLFVSLHYDAAIYTPPTGCFADWPADDTAAPRSQQAAEVWERVYPQATGIALHNERRNNNTGFYFAWRVLHQDTPAIILEHGCGAPVPVGQYPPGDDAALLHGNPDLIADADAAAILTFLGVEEPEPDPCAGLRHELAVMMADRDLNYSIKMAMEDQLRHLETRRRLRRGTTDAIIATARQHVVSP